MRTDIVVVGAGLAGVAAAVAAARAGAQVILLERLTSPGGAALGMHHRTLCGLYPDASRTPQRFLNTGLPQEFAKQLSRKAPVKMGKVRVLPCEPDGLSSVLKTKLKREKRITVCYGAEVTGCRLEKRRIVSLSFFKRGKIQEVEADVFIDAGSGILIEMCDAGRLPSASLKCPWAGYAVEISGVRWRDEFSWQVPYVLYQAVARGDLPLAARWTVASPAGDSRIYLKLSVPPEYSPKEAKRQAEEVLRVLRSEAGGFRRARIVWQSADIFRRDGVSLRGKYVIKKADVASGRIFRDAVARGAWPVEFWDRQRGPRYEYPQKDYYEIPLRSLLAKDCDNLLAAGRSVSADAGALASLRVGGLCLATGEAAGLAAAGMAGKMRSEA